LVKSNWPRVGTAGTADGTIERRRGAAGTWKPGPYFT
jgi:hypothetical protein